MDETTPGEAIAFGGEGEPTLARVARGRVVYTQACAPCHGRDGRGDTAQRLVDSQGYPAPARDFTKGIFKGGAEPRQLYARLRAGMKMFRTRYGTPTALVAAGGVAANEAIRKVLQRVAFEGGIKLVVPPGELCTDNGAMIAWAGAERLALRLTDPLDFAPRARWPLEEVAGPQTKPARVFQQGA